VLEPRVQLARLSRAGVPRLVEQRRRNHGLHHARRERTSACDALDVAQRTSAARKHDGGADRERLRDVPACAVAESSASAAAARAALA
jgi:hypothetical protein